MSKKRKKNHSQIGAEGEVTLPEVEVRPYKTIKKGDRGEDVAKWQRLIGVTADGNFGSGTDAATRKFQADHNLTVDGIVGVNTWAAALDNKSPTGMLALEWNQPSPELPSPPAPPNVIPPTPGAVPLNQTGPAAPPVTTFKMPAAPAQTSPVKQAGIMGAIDSLPTPVKLGAAALVVAGIVMSGKKKGHH